MQRSPEDSPLYRNKVVEGVFEIAIPNAAALEDPKIIIERLLSEAGSKPLWTSSTKDGVGCIRHTVSFSVPYDVIQSIHQLPSVLYVRKIG